MPPNTIVPSFHASKDGILHDSFGVPLIGKLCQVCRMDWLIKMLEAQFRFLFGINFRHRIHWINLSCCTYVKLFSGYQMLPLHSFLLNSGSLYLFFIKVLSRSHPTAVLLTSSSSMFNALTMLRMIF